MVVVEIKELMHGRHWNRTWHIACALPMFAVYLTILCTRDILSHSGNRAKLPSRKSVTQVLPAGRVPCWGPGKPCWRSVQSQQQQGGRYSSRGQRTAVIIPSVSASCQESVSFTVFLAEKKTCNNFCSSCLSHCPHALTLESQSIGTGA